MIGSVRNQVQSLDTNLAITNVQTMAPSLAREFGRRAWVPHCDSVWWAVVILAATGVYGVLSYSVNEQSTRLG